MIVWGGRKNMKKKKALETQWLWRGGAVLPIVKNASGRSFNV